MGGGRLQEDAPILWRCRALTLASCTDMNLHNPENDVILKYEFEYESESESESLYICHSTESES